LLPTFQAFFFAKNQEQVFFYACSFLFQKLSLHLQQFQQLKVLSAVEGCTEKISVFCFSCFQSLENCIIAKK
jgi:hypothetical protein